MKINMKFGKIFTVLAAVAVSVLCVPHHAGATERTVTLKQSAVLDDDYIRVGHVFENTGPYASHPLAPVPEPGKSLTLSETDILRIAEAFHFSFSPPSDRTAVLTFSRNASRIGPDEMKKILKDSDLSVSVGNDYDILFDPGTEPFDVKGKNAASFSTQNIRYSPVTEQFSADIYAFDDSLTVIGQQTLKGKAVKMISVPVLRNRTVGGTVIGDGDLTELRVPQNELGEGIKTSREDIIGMAPRRALPSMTPLNEIDLALPRIVKKNDVITVSMNRGPLSLTAKGRALTDGAKGDTISVLNLSGKKVIEAVVVSAGNAVMPTSDIY